jgi:hypothetical protein
MEIFRWAGVLGIVGFLSGFVGPMVLAPGANQGPLLGILLTGPGGALLGAILGAVVALLGIPRPVASRALYTVAGIGAVVILYFCIPAPSFRADIIDGEIRRCVLPESLRDATVARLNAIAATRPPREKPVRWEEAFDRALAERKGVVIEVRVLRRSRLYEKQAAWNQGTLTVRPWTPATATSTYFASYRGPDCAAYSDGTRALFMATGHVSIWPPSYIGEMLELKVAAPPPATVARLLADLK